MSKESRFRSQKDAMEERLLDSVMSGKEKEENFRSNWPVVDAKFLGIEGLYEVWIIDGKKIKAPVSSHSYLRTDPRYKDIF